MSGPSLPRHLLLSAAAALLAPFAVPAQEPEAPPPIISDRLEVREVEVIFEPPPGYRSALTPEDLVVLEGGERREVTRVEPLAPPVPEPEAATTGTPWDLVAYFDRRLARPEAIHRAALGLARRAQELAALGSLEIVVAGGEPEVLLPQSREPARLEQELVAVAGSVRNGGAPPARDPETVESRLKLLSRWLAARPSGSPRALLWVVDGLVLSPEEIDVLTDRSPDPPGAEEEAPGLVPALRRFARALAGRGWLALIVAPADDFTDDDRTMPEGSDFDQWKRAQNRRPNEEVSYLDLLSIFNKIRRPEERVPDATGKSLDAFWRPDLVPLQLVARATGGSVVRYEEYLDGSLRELTGRWRLWFRSVPPPEGEAPVEVRLAETDQRLWSTRWVARRTAEPPPP